MTNKRNFLVAVLLLCAMALFADAAFVKSNLFPSEQSFSYSSQVAVSGAGANLPGDAALLAVGTPDYPVRPGDVYQLSYSDGQRTIVEPIMVDSSYNVSISNIGKVSAKGLTYIEFKSKVESQVRTFYSYAKPVLTLQSCGVYSVKVAGEVTNSRDVTVWGLTRLSDLAFCATQYASTRDVRVVYEDGTTYTYDLFAASRLGNSVQNPYLEPGCTVTFQKAKTTVSLSGEVQRPGVYQPHETDTLESLIYTYGDGFTNKADTSCYYVSRYVDGVLEMINVKAEDAAAFNLQFGDAITVATKISELPSILIQGAVPDGKIYYQFFEGETVQQMARTLSTLLGAEADTKNIYVTRDDTTLNDTDILKEGDVVTVPFLYQYVTVSGAVKVPGKFVYSPDKDLNYYISQAGGYAENARKAATHIYADDGSTVKTLGPNCTINVGYRDTTAATTITLISTILTATLTALQIMTYVNK